MKFSPDRTYIGYIDETKWLSQQGVIFQLNLCRNTFTRRTAAEIDLFDIELQITGG